MTDNRSLLERAEEWQDHPVKANQQWPSEIRGLILGLAAALRATDRDLATARAATARVLPWVAGWEHLKLTDAERAWLASVSPPTSREEPAT